MGQVCCCINTSTAQVKALLVLFVLFISTRLLVEPSLVRELMDSRRGRLEDSLVAVVTADVPWDIAKFLLYE